MIDFVPNQSQIEVLQYALAARNDSDAFFDTIGVYLARPRANLTATQIIAAIQKALACLTPKNGKGGAAVLWGMPTVTCIGNNAPSPHLKATIIASVYENPLVNMGTSGTLQSAESIGQRLLLLCNQFRPVSLVSPVVVARQAMLPVQDDKIVTYNTYFETDLPQDSVETVFPPAFAFDAGAGTLSITCPLTPAAIYYTTDGSYPSPANPIGATLYAAPIPYAAGTEVRAAAYFAPLLPSQELRFKL